MKKMVLVAACLLALGTTCIAGDLPLLVGGMAHGAYNIKIMSDLGLGNFMWIPMSCYGTGNTPWNEEHTFLKDVEACAQNHLYCMVSERRGLGTEPRPGGYRFGGHCSGDAHDEATVKEFLRVGGKYFVGLHAEELDADMWQSGYRPSYRTRCPDLFDFTDRAGGRKRFEDELLRQKNLYHFWGARYIPNLCTTSHLSGFRIGPDMVLAELLESLPTTELQLAYLRGGAQQFGVDWGVWVSPYFGGRIPCEDKELWPHRVAQPGGGHSASSFRRCLYLSFVSGARLLTAQETEPLFSRDGKGGYKFAAWGRELKSFWEYARKHDARFTPMVPTAVLIDKDNGWVPAHLNYDWNQRSLVWGKLPPDRGDYMLPAFLNEFLPGFERTRESVMEGEDIYPGFFAATPLGPFDIAASDISAEKLCRYSLVILLGDVEMTPELRAALRAYVKNGGTLLVNVLQMREREAFIQDEEFLGVKLGSGILTQMNASSRIVCTDKLQAMARREFQESWFCTVGVEPAGAKVLAVDGDGHPVLLRNTYGEGVVYLSTPEYMMEGYGDQKNALNFFKALLPMLIPKSPVWVESDGDLSWVASCQGANSVVVAVANHYKSGRRANVIWRGASVKGDLDVASGKVQVKERNGATTYSISIPAEDVAVLRITVGSR